MRIMFAVPGKPQGKARPRVMRTAKGQSHTYTPDKTVAYEELVRARYLAASGGMKFPAGRALCMIVRAYYEIPKSTTKKQRTEIEAYRSFPTKKPDFDNICKIICDALNGVAYADDAQIVEVHMAKLYAITDSPRVVVMLEDEGMSCEQKS